MDNAQISQLARGDRDDAPRLLWFSTSFDIFNAAVSEHLDRARIRWGAKVTLKEAMPTRSRHILEKSAWLSSEDPFDLGEVRVRLLPDQKIELRFINPPRPDTRRFTPDEVAFWVAQPDEEAKDRAADEIYKKIEAERDEHYQWAQQFHWLVIHDFLRSLLKEIEPLSDSEGEPRDRSAAAIQQSVKRAGRPREEEDDWAWEQIHAHGRPRKEVFQEWQERNENKDRFLNDEGRSWRAAIDPNRMEKKGGRRKPD